MKGVHAIAKMQIENNESIRAIFSTDTIKYYKWLLDRRFYGATAQGTFDNRRYEMPKHKAHVTIALRKIHGWKKEWNNIHPNVTFQITLFPETLQQGGHSKMYRNFWMRAASVQIDAMKDVLGIKEKKDYHGMHMTIASNKNEVHCKNNG